MVGIRRKLAGLRNPETQVTLRKMRIFRGDIRGYPTGQAFISCDWVGRINGLRLASLSPQNWRWASSPRHLAPSLGVIRTSREHLIKRATGAQSKTVILALGGSTLRASGFQGHCGCIGRACLKKTKHHGPTKPRHNGEEQRQTDINRNNRQSEGRRYRAHLPTVDAACCLWEAVNCWESKALLCQSIKILKMKKKYSVYRCVGPRQPGRKEPWGRGMVPLGE